jgi:hypothetical protein
MNDKLTIFLAKLQQVLNLLDDIDEMIGNNPSDQSNTDTLLEDYKHLIEENADNMSNDAKINMINYYAKARLTRRNNKNFYEVTKYYNNNRQKLQYKSGRQNLYREVQNKLNNLGNKYNYRVLTDDEVKNFINYVDNTSDDKNKETNKIKHRNVKVSKDELEKLLKDGNKSVDIAKMYGVTSQYISLLKKKYGIKTRKYKKGDK